MSVPLNADGLRLAELRGEWSAFHGGAARESEFARLTDEWRAIEWRSGGKTLLDALGLQFNEVALCRGLAWLLDPEGGHNLGRHPLHAFLRSLDVSVEEGVPVKIRVEETNADSRADIVIRAGECTVIVEAKVFAGEQPRQADRIFEYWASENPTLVFLTTTGHLPYTAQKSEGAWLALRWRDLAQLLRTTAAQSGLEPAAGAREFIATIGAL